MDMATVDTITADLITVTITVIITAVVLIAVIITAAVIIMAVIITVMEMDTVMDWEEDFWVFLVKKKDLNICLLCLKCGIKYLKKCDF